jgi:hypothetical protein
MGITFWICLHGILLLTQSSNSIPKRTTRTCYTHDIGCNAHARPCTTFYGHTHNVVHYNNPTIQYNIIVHMQLL